ncbi:tetratricopeptide repeat protein [Gluconobacter sp. OJA]|uniref:tetratricopeptide repeat protein n=1 Tax=Gluconobacter sp. OJA TaxID=3145197 RepID=UPI0031F97F90
MTQDVLNNDISADQASTIAGINDFILGYLGYDLRLVKILEVADQSEDCLANTYAGLLWMLSETGDVPSEARRYHERAAQSVISALPREKLLFSVLEASIADDPDAIIRLTDRILAQWPRDLVTLKLRQYHDFIRGRFEDMLAVALRSEDAAGDVAALHGMLAFAYEQCHDLPAAERSARTALAMDASEPWAQHALAHVFLTQGRIDEGTAFLEERSAGWKTLTSFMDTHLWWHLALFYLARNRVSDAVSVYDQHCWTRERSFSQDQVGAVSLLVRLELAGADVEDRWTDLANWLASRQDDVSQPFLTLQYLYGLLRAHRPEGQHLLRRIEGLSGQNLPDQRAWDLVGIPLARGLNAYLHNENASALLSFNAALPHLQDIGGSHAQRDLFIQIHQDLKRRMSKA